MLIIIEVIYCNVFLGYLYSDYKRNKCTKLIFKPSSCHELINDSKHEENLQFSGSKNEEEEGREESEKFSLS